MPTAKMDARDAWLASSTTGNARRRASGGLDYKKFDQIVDSDDEDESRKPQPPAQMLGMPPELKLALAKVEAAKERGDQAGTMLAMAELEARLQDQPAAFKRMFLDGAGLPGKKLSTLDRKLAEIDNVAASIKALTSPVSQPPGSAANGTGGGGGGGGSSSSSSSSSALDVVALDAANAKTKAMLAELQASKEKLAAQLAEVEKHKAAAAEAAAAVAQRTKDLQEAQEKKQKQGEIVDNTVHVARKAMVEQAKIYQEEDKLRAEMFLSLKVAGLSAMD